MKPERKLRQGLVLTESFEDEALSLYLKSSWEQSLYGNAMTRKMTSQRRMELRTFVFNPLSNDRRESGRWHRRWCQIKQYSPHPGKTGDAGPALFYYHKPTDKMPSKVRLGVSCGTKGIDST